MNKAMARLAGKYHADIWFYNDSREDDLLEEAVRGLLTIKNSTSRHDIVDNVARLVRDSYSIYAAMDDEPEKYDEKEVFDRIESYFTQAFQLLGENNPERQGQAYREFWYNFYHKTGNAMRSVKIIDAIWRLHREKYDTKSLSSMVLSWRSTWRYFLAGSRGHNRRDKEKTAQLLAEYWVVTPDEHHTF